MNRKIKILSVLTSISGVIVVIFVIISFLKNNFNLFQAVKSNFEVLFVHIILLFCLIREVKISKSPLKEAISEVTNLQICWDPLTRNDEFLATFKISNNLLWTFNIPQEIYNKLIIGRQGKLAYREKNGKAYFVFFTGIDNISNTENT